MDINKLSGRAPETHSGMEIVDVTIPRDLAIDAMQDVLNLAKSTRTDEKYAIAISMSLDALKEVPQLRAQLAAMTAERDAAVADLHNMHTLCMDIGGCCPECGNQIDELLDAACTFCKGPGVSCWKNDVGNRNKCAAFNWRGPQGAGEGENHE